jgi:hypothetical protein
MRLQDEGDERPGIWGTLNSVDATSNDQSEARTT